MVHRHRLSIFALIVYRKEAEKTRGVSRVSLWERQCKPELFSDAVIKFVFVGEIVYKNKKISVTMPKILKIT